MRRFRDRQNERMFRGNELARLLSLIGMLVILAMIIRRAAEPDTWRFLTGESKTAAQLAADEPSVTAPGGRERKINPPAEPADATQLASADDSRPAIDPSAAPPAEAADAAEEEPPLDEDPEQRTAAAEEFQALTDRTPLAKEEMNAYRRLLSWADATPLPDLLKRAHANVRYGDLLLEPAEHRGELIKVQLHVVQLLKLDAPPDNPLGLETYYQAVGWNDASQAWFYFCIFVDLPSDMPIGERIEESGTFVGYFLKNTTYQDGQGKTIQAPILIGRMTWHPHALPKASDDSWLTPWILGGVILCWFVARTMLKLLPTRRRPAVVGLLRSGKEGSEEPGESVESWLDRAEAQAENEAINRGETSESDDGRRGLTGGHPPSASPRPEDRGTA